MAAITTVIPTTASASLTSKTIGIQDFTDQSNANVWQVNVSATGSVNLQGSLDNATFVNIGAAITANTIIQTVKYPYVRAVITANTGNISVYLA